MRLQVVALFFLTVVITNQVVSQLNISKRALIYEVGGTATILVALAVPVDIENRHVYVAINYAANYMTPQNATYFTQPFNRFKQKNKRHLNGQGRGVVNRSSFYKTVIRELNRYGLDGDMCLLRMICDINSAPLDNHNGVLGSIFQVVFRPSSSESERNLPTRFNEAEKAGEANNCEAYRARCPYNILDLFTQFH